MTKTTIHTGHEAEMAALEAAEAAYTLRDEIESITRDLAERLGEKDGVDPVFGLATHRQNGEELLAHLELRIAKAKAMFVK